MDDKEHEIQRLTFLADAIERELDKNIDAGNAKVDDSIGSLVMTLRKFIGRIPSADERDFYIRCAVSMIGKDVKKCLPVQ